MAPQVTTKKLGALDPGKEVDQLAKLEAKMKELKKPFDAAKAAYDEQVVRVLDVLRALNLEGAKGTVKSVTRYTEDIGTIEDPVKFWNFVHRTKNDQLIQNRISNPAYKELLALRKGKPIPGAVTITREKLSIHTRQR